MQKVKASGPSAQEPDNWDGRHGSIKMLVAGWDTKREKGSIALRAAADVVIETSLEDERPDGSRIVKLTCHKMKSIRKFEPFSIALVPVTVDSPDGAFKCSRSVTQF